MRRSIPLSRFALNIKLQSSIATGLRFAHKQGETHSVACLWSSLIATLYVFCLMFVKRQSMGESSGVFLGQAPLPGTKRRHNPPVFFFIFAIQIYQSSDSARLAVPPQFLRSTAEYLHQLRFFPLFNKLIGQRRRTIRVLSSDELSMHWLSLCL